MFTLRDKHNDASLILINFSGTEPFDVDDWRIDFDPEIGESSHGILRGVRFGGKS